MKWIGLFWVIICLVLITQINIYHNRLEDAREYINLLEEQNPSFIDIASGNDAYSNWYK